MAVCFGLPLQIIGERRGEQPGQRNDPFSVFAQRQSQQHFGLEGIVVRRCLDEARMHVARRQPIGET